MRGAAHPDRHGTAPALLLQSLPYPFMAGQTATKGGQVTPIDLDAIETRFLTGQIILTADHAALLAAVRKARSALKHCKDEMVAAARSDWTGADEYHEAILDAETWLAAVEGK